METLFPELPSSGTRPVEVAVTVPDGGSRRCVMDLLVAEADLPRAFAMAFRECSGTDGFEIAVRRFSRSPAGG